MPTFKELETWLTPSETARELGISRQALYPHLEEGRLRAVHTRAGWLADPADVERMKQERERKERTSR